VLEGNLVGRSQQVQKAMYWLPKFLNRANDKEMNLFRNLEDKIFNLSASRVTV
jgi:hypothetical protein